MCKINAGNNTQICTIFLFTIVHDKCKKTHIILNNLRILINFRSSAFYHKIYFYD